MYYALIGFIAIIIHLVVNSDVFFNKDRHPSIVSYKRYLISILVFYLVDTMWGVFSLTTLSDLLYFDTMAYYIAVAFTIIYWCRYVSSYLNLKGLFPKILIAMGIAFFIGAVIVIFVNFYNPIIFEFDESGNFLSRSFRIVAMVAQMIIFTFVSAQSFSVASVSHGSARRRNFTISAYGMAMVVTVILQFLFPLMPIYTIGLLLGTCVLHVFVQEDEKAEIRKIEIMNQNIIQALAQSYEQVNYITMRDGTYLASSNSFDVSNEHVLLKTIQKSGLVKDAIDYACSNLVSPVFRNEMIEFTDLSTIDARMTMTHLINRQFKNYNDVWYEWNYIVADRNPDGTVNHLIWAVRKIEDEKQAEIRRQQIIDENIAANNAKTVFLQNMSHEIRTPLNALFGFSQLLGMPEGSWTEEERDEYNKYILNSYYMMDMLIGDIIDIADSEHGSYRIELSDAKINEICKNALTSVDYRVPAGVNLRFETDIDDNQTVLTDGRRVQQVLVNYLTNACKHTMEGEIVLSCSANSVPGKLVFAVTDTGEGVPEDMADEIFNRFTKLDQFKQGSGLGLNICQMVATKLNGSVYLDKSYKSGARFIFEIDR